MEVSGEYDGIMSICREICHFPRLKMYFAFRGK